MRRPKNGAILADVGGCTNCSGKAGCDDRKGGMFAAIEAALARLYPSRDWGTRESSGEGISAGDGHALAEELATSLNASTFYREGSDLEYCNYIYVLCLGREPCLVQLRDGEVPLPEELENSDTSELYLRLCLSTIAPFAAAQQVGLSGQIRDDELFVVESPRAGVYDAPLLPRMQKLVGVLAARGIEHLDFGDISAPPEGFAAADYAARYGVAAPALANYLFYPQPATTESSELVRLSRAAL